MKSIRNVQVISFGVFTASFLVFFVAFGTSYWVVLSTGHHGLWQICDDDDCDIIDEPDLDFPGFHLWTVRACMFAAGCCYLLSFALYCVWIFKTKPYLCLRRTHEAGTAATSVALAAAYFTSLAVVLFGFFYYGIEILGWSYILACISCLNFANCIATLATTSCSFRGDGPSIIQPGRTMTIMTTQAPHVQDFEDHSFTADPPQYYTTNPDVQLDTFPPPYYNNPRLYPTAPLPQGNVASNHVFGLRTYPEPLEHYV